MTTRPSDPTERVRTSGDLTSGATPAGPVSVCRRAASVFWLQVSVTCALVSAWGEPLSVGAVVTSTRHVLTTAAPTVIVDWLVADWVTTPADQNAAAPSVAICGSPRRLGGRSPVTAVC